MDTSERSDAIAIIGMGCRYPGGAHSPEELWDLVASSRDTWSEVPNDRFNAQAFYHPDPEAPEAVGQKGGHFLHQALADFDPGFFDISASEAAAVDPLQRVVLETAWEAFRGSNTAVYMAMFGHDAEQLTHKDALGFNRYQYYGVTRPLLANRLLYLFDLHGPSIMLDTACSGSLVAIHLACQALRLGEAATAITGGVSLIFNPDQMGLMSLVGAFNSDGRSYTWDERGDGYGRGEGVSMVIVGPLKRLRDAMADGDPIRAVIRNSAVNQDGKTNGISLPSQTAQELLAHDVFRGLPFSHEDVQYAEAHGTGTKAGDKIEMQAIRSVLASDREADKPLFAASGAAGLIRTVMAMEKGQIAPQALLNKFKPGLEPNGWNIIVSRLHYSTLLDSTIADARKIPREMTPWPAIEGYRRAVVNSFGFGGTNCMLVLESAAQEKLLSSNGTSSSKETPYGIGATETSKASRLFVISAKSEYSAAKAIEGLKTHLKSHMSIDLDALSYTLANRRTHFPWRFAKSLARKSLTALVFTGQGAQWARMGHRLLAISPVFRKSQLGADWSLMEELSRSESSTRLNDSRFGQPASTAIQLALVDLLRSWGIVPAAVLGHSSGEIAAAYAAGALTSGAAMLVSYHRGFLAGLSRERAMKPGAMVAVGLGEKEVAGYLEGREGLIAVCINSPSSLTVSGDKEEIEELEGALRQDQVFYRRLQVDTAYHSYHMNLELDSSTTSPTTRFFSTVTEREKHEHFAASYWVSNLISPVRFAGSGGQVVDLVEVGPHKALAGPVRQTLHQQQIDGLLYTYMATLERGENCLYKAGVYGLDPGIVAALGISDSKPSPIPLTNLPPYAWDHRIQYWAESRLSREYRFRRHAYHDLLGSRVIASPGTQPSWRMLLSHEKLPWLKDHMVDDIAVFPAAGYMTMAIQGLAQVQDSSPIPARRYHLKRITFKRALFLPKDAREVEIMLTFRYLDSDNSYDFAISSFSVQGKWFDHCTGNISRREDEAFADSSDEQRLLSHFEDAKKACVNFIGNEELYSRLAALGNYYGPCFSVSKEVRLGAFQAVNTPHIIHPTVLDGVLQTALPIFAQHAQPGSFMPPYIADVWISTDLTTQPGQQLGVVCDLSDTFTRSTNFEISAFQYTQYTVDGVNPSPHCILTISGGEALVVGDAKAATESEQEKEKRKRKQFIWKSQWGLDIMSVTAEMLESVVVPLQSDEAGMTQGEKVDLLNAISARYIGMAIQEIDSNLGGTDAVAKDFRKHQWRSFQALASSANRKELISRVPISYAELAQLAASLGAEGEAMERIGSKLVQVLTGQTDALGLLLEDQLLFRIYHGDEGARASQYMADYVAHLTFQRPGLRILEVGAGTGGTTAKVLKACSQGNTAPFCAEYMFTDISSGFFDEVRSGLLKPWAHMFSFQVFDLEQDPITQDFEANAYDLIIAANVVHATASIRKSLRCIRKLLKPGGVLGLVELTRSLTWGGMVFGCLEGWPCANAEKWDGHLRASGFSGVDLVAYDLPEPQRHSALLLSTALPEVIADKAQEKGAVGERGEAPIEVLSALPETSANAEFVESLALELINTNQYNCSYVILDSAENYLITNATSERFSRMIGLLREATTLYWVTFAGTKGKGKGIVEPDNALVTGLARCFTLDVQDDVTISQTLARMALGVPLEFEFSLRDGLMRIQRLVTEPSLRRLEMIPFFSTEKLRLEVQKPGLLGSLSFVVEQEPQPDLGPYEVEIKPQAWGVNFKDTMVGELAGVIVGTGSKASEIFQLRPGDRVAAFATFKSYYSNLARTDASFLHKLPESMTWVEAASLPVAFATASYSLVDCARLEPGNTVLAAVEIAMQTGATVFATAGTPEKRQFVAERFGIPKSRIFSSRTADFVRVLNSLAGPLLSSSWECVADLGTFIELGKVDIWKRGQISMEPFGRGVRFVSPEVMRRVLQRVFSDVTAGLVRPLPPATTYSIGDVEMAFRYMQAGKHVGKIVLEADRHTTVISQNRKRRPPPPRLSSNATYIIAGGLGAVGKALCLHLQVLGARYFVLVSRRQLSDGDRLAQEQALTCVETPGSLVKIVTCDVSDQQALRRAAMEIQDSNFPPVKGVIQGALADFDVNLWSTFAAPQPLDFFLPLSSMSGIIGSLGQGNYAATATYQDMFSHAVALTVASSSSEPGSDAGARQTLTKNVVSLDIPLIRNTQDVTQEHVEALHRQGGLSVEMEDAFTIIDYAISGRAVSDGCHHISFGIHPELVRGVPLMSHAIFDYKMQQRASSTRDGALTRSKTKQNIDKAIAAAASAASAEALILTGLRDKVSSLTAVGGQLDFDVPVAGMGLDSLIATELKNWIFNTLSARVQNADIVDAPSLRALAAQIAQVSTLLIGKKSEVDEVSDMQKKDEGEASMSDRDGSSASTRSASHPDVSVRGTNEALTPITNVSDEHALPKYPVQTLKQVLDNFIEAVSHIGTPMELRQTLRAIEAFLDPHGMGQVMQTRLEESSRSTAGNDSDTSTKADHGDVVEMYVRSKWLRTRSWRPRLRNFFGTLPGTIPSDSEPGRSQVSRAAMLSLDQGKVQQDYQHDQPLSMDTVHWLFNAHRTPAIGCDRMDRWPGNDYIVVMRRGHVFKVPLQDSGATPLTPEHLATIFDGILAHPAPAEVNWACLFTTAHRDEWATIRDQFITTKDASPSTPAERAEVFLLDDNSNRWLDKTMGFIVCANGVAAAFLEHTMVDGTTFEGLAKALADYEEDQHKLDQPGTRTNDRSPITSSTEHLAAHDGYKLVNYDLTSYGTRWLREHCLPPKSVIQVLVQLAVRLVLGTNPSAVDVVSQRPFRGGRTDMIYTSIPEITTFCEAAVATIKAQDILVLFKEAVRAHAKLLALAQRGKGWRWHLAALGEMLRGDEELPELYRDPVYLRTGERRVATSFTEFGVPEMGRCPPKREDVWFGIEAFEERVHFTVINGQGRSKDFVEKLAVAANTIRGIITWLSWTIRVVDNILESANYALNYVDGDFVDETFVKRTMDEPYVEGSLL
ncbi:hypothetical protein GGR55DRAFT_691540 [Xylaria sp. FL0064]|nr:hypothetical protein GGR55DRAFT_691540 [Xylaria sp. FL0064]